MVPKLEAVVVPKLLEGGLNAELVPNVEPVGAPNPVNGVEVPVAPMALPGAPKNI